VEENIIFGHNVEKLTMLKERYLSYILKHYPSVYNENYKTYKFKDKLIKHFQKQPESVNTTSELVYGAHVEGNAIEKAFELADSDEKRLIESAMILCRYFLECRHNSCDMPWPPSANWLLSENRHPPTELVNFFIFLKSGKSSVSFNTNPVSSKAQRYANFFLKMCVMQF